MTCRECWEDPCECEPEPLEDFENGYTTELAPRWPTPADWHERANADPFTMSIYLRTVFDAGERMSDLYFRNSTALAMLTKPPEPIVVSPQLYASIESEVQRWERGKAQEAFYRASYDTSAWQGNRATRRARKAMRRARR